MRQLVIISALMFLSLSLAHGQERDGPSFSIVGDLQRFDYREYSDQEKLLDQENGFLPGLLLGIEHSKGPWQFAGQFSYHAGGVTYTGQTNGGEPIATTTRQQMINAELRTGYQFQQMQNIQSTLYFGAANHSWQRNIQPTYTSTGLPVRGLMETYHWWQAFLGANISAQETSAFCWGLDTRLTRTIAPKIEVDYFGLYDKVQLGLGERWGFRLAFPMSYTMSQSITLALEPYLEKYALGRSQSATLTSQGIIQGTVFEPDSTGKNYGVLLGIRKFY